MSMPKVLVHFRPSPSALHAIRSTRLLFPAAVIAALTPFHASGFDSYFAFQQPHQHACRLPTSFLSTKNNSESYSSAAVKSTRPSSDIAKDAKFQLLSFYRFIPISEPESIRDILFERLEKIPGLRGTVYVATEGVNAQFAVPIGDPLKVLLETFGRNENGSGCLPFDMFEENPPNMGKVVESDIPTFDRLIVRTRDCILRDGIGEDSTFDWSDAGEELNPEEWHSQLSTILLDKSSECNSNASNYKIQLLDCRNNYESDQGTFLSSTHLNTRTFSETWSILDTQVESRDLDPSEPVYIFCTGGIRCVKVGAYLKQKLGFEDVRSLRHGIIGYERWWNEEGRIMSSEQEVTGEGDNYSEDDGINRSTTESLWVGENFLFDKRRFAKHDDTSSRNQ
ncbi:hypothetical protein ACHAXS_000634 [Conticribra weissflogii]